MFGFEFQNWEGIHLLENIQTGPGPPVSTPATSDHVPCARAATVATTVS
jgi:hypothetical protein